ncbi:hypothetical protein NQ318_004686 [Aromia moschata]|uniref:DDE Tnp4 domain-containing protein n=1 Tax=Aromia moschata TaxID=1265417 RepID=A0AAV8X533_9CUCU|nr:hypothetical protein NQ318_004686 [Aromia moschata]
MGYTIIKRLRRSKSRTKWFKTWLLRKDLHHMQLLKVIQDDPDDFKNYLRMNENTFNYLLFLVKGALTKQDTVMTKAIPPEERLIATLRYLATGRYYNCLRFSAGISEQALGYIIPETCRVLYEVLRKEYMKCPRTKEEWIEVAEEFRNRWQFINCGGALDGKHIRITKPPHSGATYYNYKGFYSIALMALVNADYKFIWLDVGQQGRISDGAVFEWTPSYVTQSTFDRLNKKTWTIDKGDWRNEIYEELTPLQPCGAKNVSTCAKKTRDEYCEFFNTSGKVEWQETMIAKGKA